MGKYPSLRKLPFWETCTNALTSVLLTVPIRQYINLILPFLKKIAYKVHTVRISSLKISHYLEILYIQLQYLGTGLICYALHISRNRITDLGCFDLTKPFHLLNILSIHAFGHLSPIKCSLLWTNRLYSNLFSTPPCIIVDTPRNFHYTRVR